MDFPVYFNLFGKQFSAHLLFESLAFFVGFRYYLFLKKDYSDTIPAVHRIYAIAGAIGGALIGSRLLGALENPEVLTSGNWLEIYKSKTIIGGLFGGLLGVELVKKLVGEKQSTGDLFVLPLILGIFIGRIGCFLTGTIESTYGIQTASVFGMDLGDGIKRHPLALYEMFYLLLLFVCCFWMFKKRLLENGSLFKLFMVLYFLFRFLAEFLKPNVFFALGLSSVQWCCLACFYYYYKCIINPKELLKHA